MIKKGHSYPSKFGFTGSSGKVQQVGGYTRKAPTRSRAPQVAPPPVPTTPRGKTPS
jgi:hypothetical protein